MIFKGSGCFQVPEAVVTSAAKKSLRCIKRGSLQALAVLWEQKLQCTTVTNIGIAKVSLCCN